MYTRTFNTTIDVEQGRDVRDNALQRVARKHRSKLLSYNTKSVEPARDFRGHVVNVDITVGRWFPYTA